MGRQKLRLAVVFLSIGIYTFFTIIAPLYSANVVDLIWNRIKEAAAGAAQPELNGLPVDADDFEVAAIRLQVHSQFFKSIRDFLAEFIHLISLPVFLVMSRAVRTIPRFRFRDRLDITYVKQYMPGSWKNQVAG